jgi:hypothetical protein
MITPVRPSEPPAPAHWSARPWFGLVVGVAAVAPWAVLVAVPTLSPVVVFGGPVLAGLVAGALMDRAAVPGLIAGVGYALPALAVLTLDPCKTTQAWSETLAGAILLLVVAPVVGVLGSRFGARIAQQSSSSAGSVVLAVIVVAIAVAAGVVVLAGRTFVVGCAAI